MLKNLQDAWVGERLQWARETMPEIEPFLTVLQEHPDPFSARQGKEGIDFASEKPVEGRPNRARIKIFTMTDGPMKKRSAVFFYKESQVPFSSDRHSYGVCIVPSTDLSREEALGWLHFASSGFDPAERPENLRRAFTFTVPD